MRTLIWTDSDCFAGTERHCLDLSRSLMALGHQVSVGARPNTPLSEQVLKGGGALVFLEGMSSPASTIFELRKRLKQGEIDVIHAHNGVSSLLSCLAVARARRGRVVVTEHFIAPARTRRRGMYRRLSKAVHRWMDRRISRRIAISKAVADSIKHRADTAPSKIRLVLNGVAPPPDGELRRVTARERLGLPQEAPMLLCPARLEPEKGHVTYLNALAMLQAEGVAFESILIGGGSLFGMLEQRIRELGLQQRVRLAGHQSDAGPWMQASDLVVLPSPMEPFGLVLAEAMSRGIPVVAADSGGPREIVNESSGRLFAPGDQRELATRLFELLRHPESLVELGAGALERWRSCFRADRMAREVAAVYHEVHSSQC